MDSPHLSENDEKNQQQNVSSRDTPGSIGRLTMDSPHLPENDEGGGVGERRGGGGVPFAGIFRQAQYEACNMLYPHVRGIA